MNEKAEVSVKTGRKKPQKTKYKSSVRDLSVFFGVQSRG